MGLEGKDESGCEGVIFCGETGCSVGVEVEMGEMESTACGKELSLGEVDEGDGDGSEKVRSIFCGNVLVCGAVLWEVSDMSLSEVGVAHGLVGEG
jgi:hypothetical protein